MKISNTKVIVNKILFTSALIRTDRNYFIDSE
jgi:hypothetical protein